MRDVAIEAAKKGGEVLAKYFEMTGLEREVKDDTSFVTKADKEAEAVIVDVIRAAFPDHGILGEEGADVNPDARFKWIIDPLDGTSNFVNGIPLFAVSIAVADGGDPVVAVVYNPVTNSLYVAEKGKGATYNGRPARVSDEPANQGTVSFGPAKKEKNRARRMVVATGEAFKSARILGCCALELAYISRGGTEAFVCLDLKKWDYAAGVLLVREAGGKVTDMEGNDCTLAETYFVASNGVAHDAVRSLANSVE
jgi:myo-inositol-1(or 4)-monophosphatase